MYFCIVQNVTCARDPILQNNVCHFFRNVFLTRQGSKIADLYFIIRVSTIINPIVYKLSPTVVPSLFDVAERQRGFRVNRFPSGYFSLWFARSFLIYQRSLTRIITIRIQFVILFIIFSCKQFLCTHCCAFSISEKS